MTSFIVDIWKRIENKPKKPKKSWSSSAARGVSRRNGFIMPLGQDFFGRESGTAPVQQLYDYKTFTHRPDVQLFIYSFSLITH